MKKRLGLGMWGTIYKTADNTYIAKLKPEFYVVGSAYDRLHSYDMDPYDEHQEDCKITGKPCPYAKYNIKNKKALRIELVEHLAAELESIQRLKTNLENHMCNSKNPREEIAELKEEIGALEEIMSTENWKDSIKIVYVPISKPICKTTNKGR